MPGAHGTSRDLGPELAALFAPEGGLGLALHGYEQREEQLTLAYAMGEALRHGGQLLAEAGTGTGKTLSYLAPAVLSGRTVVVSTATKALQEQIIREDVPLLSRALGRAVDVQVMKGRGNYVCRARMQRYVVQPTLPSFADGTLVRAVIAWAAETESGDRAELDELPDQSPLWREMSATADQCPGRLCRDFERCFVTRMRRRAEGAALVIVNHHLYLADVALRHRALEATIALVPPHDFVVFDEAHELEEVSTHHFGVEVAETRLHELCRDASAAAASDQVLRRHLATLGGAAELEWRRLFATLPVTEARTLLVAPHATSEVLAQWHAVAERLLALESSLSLACCEEGPTLARRAASLAADLRFALGIGIGDDDDACAAREREHGRTIDRSADFSQVAESEPPGASGRNHAPRYVRFTELHGHARAVVARPIDVAPLLGAELASMPAAFVSATLSVGGDFRHLKRRLGLTQASELVVDSPFDYATQAALYVANDLPSPSSDDFAPQATARALELVSASQGGAFVLCTSHRMLEVMRDALTASGLSVLAQGEAPKQHLLADFRRRGDAVLCATLSFWQGIDVPGHALRLVIIDKLPFASPADPLTAARLAHLGEQGLDAFTMYQIPQAALLLRQGFGRLIRRKTDRGLVALLDHRIHTRAYGTALLAALPPCQRLYERDEALDFLRTEARHSSMRQSPRDSI